MRLTMFSRLLIVVAILAAAFFAFRYFMNKNTGANTTPKTEQTNPTDRSGETTDEPAKDNTSNINNNASTDLGFNFTPPAPSNGKLKGVVELGASGFNSFIVTLDKDKNWKLEKAEFGASLVLENMATPTDIREGLKNYIANMLNFGVSGKDIHFVTSSGASKEEAVKKISAGLKTLGYVVNPVTAELEGQLAFKSTMPKAYEEDAFVVDIGSSNTKISWLENGQIKSLEGPGSKYFQRGQTDEAVYNQVSALASKIPENRRLVCFIIGGAAFEMAKTHRNAKERYTVLKAPDDYADVKEQKTKSGINIYKAIRAATNTETFVFDWDSNFTIGFLLTLPN